MGRDDDAEPVPLDPAWLERLGVELRGDPQLIREALKLVHGWLAAWVGAAMSAGLTDAQLAEFEEVSERSEEEAGAWLAEHVPSYREVVRDVHCRIGRLIASDPGGFRSAVQRSCRASHSRAGP